MQQQHSRLFNAAAGLLVCSAAALCGCATTDDPSQGGLIGGLYGISSGKYEQRVEAREQELARLRAADREMQADNDELALERQDKRREVAAERSQVAEMERRTSAMERRAATLDADAGGR
jgi:hypothetical protein